MSEDQKRKFLVLFDSFVLSKLRFWFRSFFLILKDKDIYIYNCVFFLNWIGWNTNMFARKMILSAKGKNVFLRSFYMVFP